MLLVPGGMAEWLKAHAWKACIQGNRIVGSNPHSLRQRAVRLYSPEMSAKPLQIHSFSRYCISPSFAAVRLYPRIICGVRLWVLEFGKTLGCRSKDLQWKLFLWGCPIHGDRRTRKYGLLSLQFLPSLVDCSCKRLHLVAARKREGYAGRRKYWNVQ